MIVGLDDDDSTGNLGFCTSSYVTESDLIHFFQTNNNVSLNLLHINCRSLNKNFGSVTNLLHRIGSKLSVLGLCETWLNKNTENSFHMQGYNFACNSRSSRMGGGVGLYVDNSIQYSLRNDLSIMSDELECIFVELVQKNSANIIVGCVYRPPNTDPYVFNMKLLPLLNLLNRNNKSPTFIMGDFNLDLLQTATHVATSEFLNTLISHSYFPTIRHPTRVTDSSATLLDDIFTNNCKYEMFSAIMYCDISDHYPVALHVDLIPEKYNSNTGTSQKMRVFTSDAIEEFVHDLSTHDWNEVIHNFVNRVDLNISYDWFALKFKRNIL